MGHDRPSFTPSVRLRPIPCMGLNDPGRPAARDLFDLPRLVEAVYARLVANCLHRAAEHILDQLPSLSSDDRPSVLQAGLQLPDLLAGISAGSEPIGGVKASHELSLLPDSYHDFKIALDQLRSKMDRASAYTVWHLRQRLTGCQHNKSVTESIEGLFPGPLVDRIAKLFEARCHDPLIRTILLRSISAPLVDRCLHFYRELDAALEGAGVSPAPARSLVHEEAREPPPETTDPLSFEPQFFVPVQWLPGERFDPHLTADALEPLALVHQVMTESLGGASSAYQADLRSLQQAATVCAIEHRTTLYRAGHPLWSILDAVQPLAALPTLARRIAGSQVAASLRDQALASNAQEHITSDLLNDLRHRKRAPDPSRVHRDAAEFQFQSAANGRDLPSSLGPWIRDQWLPLAAVIRRRFAPSLTEFRSLEPVLARLFDNARWLPWSSAELAIEMVVSRFLLDLERAGVPEAIRPRTAASLRAALCTLTPAQMLDHESLGPRTPLTPSMGRVAQEAHGEAGRWRTAFPFDAWFRIYDRRLDATRWMTVGVFHPGDEHLRFKALYDHHSIDIRRSHLLVDLRYGRASPIEATESQLIALAELTRSVKMDHYPASRVPQPHRESAVVA